MIEASYTINRALPAKVLDRHVTEDGVTTSTYIFVP